MSQSAAIVDTRYTAARERPPAGVTGPWAWARRNLFGSWWSTAVTLVLGYLILRILISFVSWAFLNAVWSVPYNAQGVADTASVPARQGRRCLLGDRC